MTEKGDAVGNLRASKVGQNPFDGSSLLSQLFFNWTGGLLELGSKRTITNQDLPEISTDDESSALLAKLLAALKQHKDCKRPLLRAMFTVFAPHYSWIGCLVMIQIPVRIWQANLLGYLSNVFFDINNSEVALYNNGYAIAALLVSCSFFSIMLNHQYGFRGGRFGIQTRIALLGVIYSKAVKLHLRSMSKASTGSIVSLASQDVEILQLCGMFVHYSYLGLLEAATVLYFGIQLVGWPFLAGFVAIILLVPLQYLFSRMMGRNRKQTAAYTDERMKIVNQALVGVRVMKMNGWEWAFNDLIQEVRRKELGSLMQTNYLKAINEAIFFSAPIVISCIVWVSFVQSGGTLTPRKMFTVMAYLNSVQLTLTKFFGMAVQFTTESYVSIERVDALLRLENVVDRAESVETKMDPMALEPELKSDDVSLNVELTAVTPAAVVKSAESIISCKNMCASWTEAEPGTKVDESMYTLTDINYEVHSNELIVVVGTVGSSKSSMLMALLGELTPLSGSVTLGKDVTSSYCAQEPWIMSSTIRSNILFGRKMDQKWYDQVVTSCALLSDFEMLPHGDQTVIGDRGVNLSGGQRARVGLARAVYGRATLNLLDDPLSAVDPNISAQLFNSVVCGTMRGSTRVLVTHQTQYLSSPSVSRVMILDRGKIVAFDSYTALKDSGAMAQWIDVLQQEERRMSMSKSISMSADASDAGSALSESRSRQVSRDVSKESGCCNQKPAGFVAGVEIHDSDIADLQVSSVVASLTTEPEEPSPDRVATSDTAVAIAGITVAEEIGFGDIGWKSISAYAGYVGSIAVWIPLVLLLIAGQAAAVLVMIYLARWSKMDRNDQLRESTLNIYYVLVSVAVFLAVLKACVWFKALTVASLRMHDTMLISILRAPILFFDSNPLGRVLNRFSKDIASADNLMPELYYEFCTLVLMVLSTLTVVCIGSPMVLIVIIPLALAFLNIRSYYMRTARELKRIEAASRSPIFSHLTESLDGLVTIRAFNRLESFLQVFHDHVNLNMSAFFMYTGTARWLAVRLDCLAIVLFAAVVFGGVALKANNAGVEPALLSVGVVYVIQLTGLFQWTVRQSAEVENLMVSVERIVAYRDVAPEPPLLATDMLATDCKAICPPPEWPTHGKIDVNNLVCSYRADLPPVINDVSFTIKAGQRVGIVGRTGAGKSSLMSVLLRLIDIVSGSVAIDGIDISHIGLHDLRKKLSVIPQVPFLFLGSLRQNLDMFGEHSDTAIWDAIDSLSLRSILMQKTVVSPQNTLSASSSTGKAVGDGGNVADIVADSVAEYASPSGSSLLDTQVAENGSNFSVGERQLLCLCRAMLQKNKILIMDEATANVDMDTDRDIQRAVRSCFTSSTVLMIAHRLQTVIDCDVVIVLSNGKLVEIGHPHELLTKSPTISGNIDNTVNIGHDKVHDKDNRDNRFKCMVEDTGPEMSKQLHDAARCAFEQSSMRTEHK